MIRMLKAGHHELSSPDRLYPGSVAVDVPTKGLACVSFRSDGIQSIWLFGGGDFRVCSRGGEARVVVYASNAAIEARGRVTAFNSSVKGYIAVSVEALGNSQVEVFDNACSIVGRQQSVGVLHRKSTGEFFDSACVKALGSSRAVVHGENGFNRVIEGSRTAKVIFERD